MRQKRKRVAANPEGTARRRTRAVVVAALMLVVAVVPVIGLVVAINWEGRALSAYSGAAPGSMRRKDALTRVVWGLVVLAIAAPINAVTIYYLFSSL